MKSPSSDGDELRTVFFGDDSTEDDVGTSHQPVQSTQDATLWLRRYHPEQLEAWLQRHEPGLRTWLNKQPTKKLLW
jgi:hypothetical protein